MGRFDVYKSRWCEGYCEAKGLFVESDKSASLRGMKLVGGYGVQEAMVSRALFTDVCL